MFVVVIFDAHFISICICVHMFLPFKYVPLYAAVFLGSNDWLIRAYAANWEHNADFKATHDKKRKKPHSARRPSPCHISFRYVYVCICFSLSNTCPYMRLYSWDQMTDLYGHMRLIENTTLILKPLTIKTTTTKKKQKNTEPGDHPHATNIINKMPINCDLLHIKRRLGA